jgi:hypothetical protein
LYAQQVDVVAAGVVVVEGDEGEVVLDSVTAFEMVVVVPAVVVVSAVSAGAVAGAVAAAADVGADVAAAADVGADVDAVVVVVVLVAGMCTHFVIKMAKYLMMVPPMVRVEGLYKRRRMWVHSRLE